MKKIFPFKVGDYFETKKDGTIGVILLVFGVSTIHKIYGSMFPGADSGYEYITLYLDKEHRSGKQKIELVALNAYTPDEIKKITKQQYDRRVQSYWNGVRRSRGKK